MAQNIYGTYNAGCIVNSATIKENQSMIIMRPQRERFFGDMITKKYLENLSHKINQIYWHKLLIGDISKKHGMPMEDGHSSHQIGLDIDLWLIDKLPKHNLYYKNNYPALSYVTTDQKLRNNWSDKQRNFILLAADDEMVDRIFVNPAIKYDLCMKIMPNNSKYALLSKIRPWYGHDEHIHIRLKCPTSQAKCISQQPLSNNSGCDDSLKWWFSDAAKTPDSSAKAIKKSAILPKECSILPNK